MDDDAGYVARQLMQKYKCARCGYIYDPAVGRPDKGIKPGIPFEDLPDDWTCPECGGRKQSWPPWAKLGSTRPPASK